MILRLLAKQPDARYGTATELLATLVRAEREAEERAWRPPAPDERTPLDVARARAPLAEDEVLTTVRRIAAQLQARHRRGEPHGALALSRLRIGVLGDVQLGPTDPSAPTDPRVQAPELTCRPEGSPAADLYAVGAIAAALATGRLPFDGDTVEGLTRQHAAGPPDLQQLPPGLRHLLLNLLATQPRHRYATADELLEELDLLEGGRTPQLRAPRSVWCWLAGLFGAGAALLTAALRLT